MGEFPGRLKPMSQRAVASQPNAHVSVRVCANIPEHPEKGRHKVKKSLAEKKRLNLHSRGERKVRRSPLLLFPVSQSFR